MKKNAIGLIGPPPPKVLIHWLLSLEGTLPECGKATFTNVDDTDNTDATTIASLSTRTAFTDMPHPRASLANSRPENPLHTADPSRVVGRTHCRGSVAVSAFSCSTAHPASMA